ncbi:MAG: enoyl-CoA hydratase/isomerase family protein [Hyphomicrobiales bacterium]
MSFATIETKVQGATGWIRLNRPQVRNALSAQCFAELDEALVLFGDNKEVRSVVLIGNGGNFSSGRDFKDRDVPPDFEERRARTFTNLETFPKPTIAAVAGYAITGGMTLALACDLILAASNAVFQDTHARLGALTLRASRVYEVLGPLKARELLFTCRRVDAHDALDMGLVNRVVDPDELESSAAELAAEINSHDPQVVAGIKRVINKVLREDQFRLLELEELEKRRFNDLKSERSAMDKGLELIAKPKEQA